MNDFEDHAIFLRFLGTFLFLAFNASLSTSLLKEMKLNETFSNLIKTCAFLHQSCSEIWKKLAKTKISEIMTPNFDVSIDARTFPLWQNLQDCLNDICRDISMWHWDVSTTLRIVIDDDKQCFDVKIGSDNVTKNSSFKKKSSRHGTLHSNNNFHQLCSRCRIRKS